MKNAPYPGKCSRYIDSDNDGICDYFQSWPDERENYILKNRLLLELAEYSLSYFFLALIFKFAFSQE